MRWRNVVGWMVLIFGLAGCNLQSDPTPTTATTPVVVPPTVAAPPTIAALPVADGNLTGGVCYFKPYGIGAPFSVYSEPATSQMPAPAMLAEIDAGVNYPVVSAIDVWVEIVAAEGVIGWVRMNIGAFSDNCDNIPRSTSRPPLPEGICTIYFDEVAPGETFYADMEGVTPLEPLTAGQYFTVEARGMSRGFKVKLADGRTAWILTPDQLLLSNKSLQGPCDDRLPVITPEVGG